MKKQIIYFLILAACIAPEFAFAQSQPGLIYTGRKDRCGGIELSKLYKRQQNGENVETTINHEKKWLEKNCTAYGPIKKDPTLVRPDPGPITFPIPPKSDNSHTETVESIVDPRREIAGCPSRDVTREVHDGRWFFYYCHGAKCPCRNGEKTLIYSVVAPEAGQDTSYVVDIIPILVNKNDKSTRSRFVPFPSTDYFPAWLAGRIDYPNPDNQHALSTFFCETVENGKKHGAIHDTAVCGNYKALLKKVNRKYEFRFIVPGQSKVYLINGGNTAKEIAGWDPQIFKKTGNKNSDKKLANFLYNLAVIAAFDPGMIMHIGPRPNKLKAFISGAYEGHTYSLGVSAEQSTFYIPVKLHAGADQSYHLQAKLIRDYSRSVLKGLATKWYDSGEEQIIRAYLPSNLNSKTNPMSAWGNPSPRAHHPTDWGQLNRDHSYNYLVEAGNGLDVYKNGVPISIDSNEAGILKSRINLWLNWLFIADPKTIILETFGSNGFSIANSKPNDIYAFRTGSRAPNCIAVLKEMRSNDAKAEALLLRRKMDEYNADKVLRRAINDLLK